MIKGESVFYNEDKPFEQLHDGYTTECRLAIRLVTWCIVKFYCHVTLCISCHLLIVSNDIRYLGIQVISQN